MNIAEPTPREKIRAALSAGDPDSARWKALDEVLELLPAPEAFYLEPDKARFVAGTVLHEITASEPETGKATVTVKFKGLKRRIADASLEYTFRFDGAHGRPRQTKWEFTTPDGDDLTLKGEVWPTDSETFSLLEAEELARAAARVLGIGFADEPAKP